MHEVFAALARNAAHRPDAPAFRDEAQALDWRALAARVSGLTHALADAPPVIGIAVPGGVDFVVADLAVTLSGRRLVPVPFFFSPEQQAHVLADADVGAIIGAPRAASFGLPVIAPNAPDPARGLRDYGGGATRVIYTSGSSGRPKGVVLGDRQLSASVLALADVVEATAGDKHLSVLPLAQLLEQTCGVFLPILAGAETVFSAGATFALLGGPVAPFMAALARENPTTTLVAPSLLARWLDAIDEGGSAPPASLRFVAVGGAVTPPSVLARAQAQAIPVCEGYGLSECCAVVAMNAPGDAMAGTVGRILDPLDVKIIDGEITVAGPTVMQGYLNGAPAPERWHTGDNGHFHDGRLVVEGRRDALIVTGAGRNISPEWVESRVTADRRIKGAALCHGPDDRLILVVAPTAPVTPADIGALLSDLPAYARAEAVVFADTGHDGLFFPAGTPNRAVAADVARTGARLSLVDDDEACLT
ncbi:AMP-binding protein [Roseovarius sp.]|uniref:AMP-binding protein n=1 Tax=Roseovarius sp. TaxID=1486281 RepID=UPI002623D504|nr:AMP-binding protein [Roseovarius sp.]